MDGVCIDCGTYLGTHIPLADHRKTAKCVEARWVKRLEKAGWSLIGWGPLWNALYESDHDGLDMWGAIGILPLTAKGYDPTNFVVRTWISDTLGVLTDGDAPLAGKLLWESVESWVKDPELVSRDPVLVRWLEYRRETGEEGGDYTIPRSERLAWLKARVEEFEAAERKKQRLPRPPRYIRR